MDTTHETLTKAYREIDKLVRRPTQDAITKAEFLKKAVRAYKETEGLRDRGSGAYEYALNWYTTTKRDGSLNADHKLSVAEMKDRIRLQTTKLRRADPEYKERNLQAEEYGPDGKLRPKER